MARYWTERDDRRFTLYAQGLTDRLIAETEGVHRHTICDWRRGRSLPPNDSLTISFRYANAAKQELGRERRRLIERGWTDGDLGRHQERDAATIRGFRKVHGLSEAPPKKAASLAFGRQDHLPHLVSYEASYGDHYVADPSWSNWLEEMGATVW